MRAGEPFRSSVQVGLSENWVPIHSNDSNVLCSSFFSLVSFSGVAILGGGPVCAFFEPHLRPSFCRKFLRPLWMLRLLLWKRQGNLEHLAHFYLAK